MRISISVAENWIRGTIAFLAWLVFASRAPAQQVEPCPRCNWSPPRTAVTTAVRTVSELRRAVGRAQSGTTVLLEDGVYGLERTQLEISVPGLVLRGKNGAKARVLIRGAGMGWKPMTALSVTAPRVTLADMTISQVGHHGVQVRGELDASDVVIHRLHILDTGQQLIKGSAAAGRSSCRNGLVACSTLEYTNTAPSDYTNGVDVLNGEGWVVRDNIIRRIRGPRAKGFRAGPAILFWRASRDTIVERNLIVDCQRAIALGLEHEQKMFPGRPDHEGGVIRRNIVCNLNSWADEAIEVNSSPGTRVEHNTVLVEGKVPWSISIRFPATKAQVWNNLSNHQVILRDGATADLKANIVTARRDWFVDSSQGDLRLARGDSQAIDAGIVVGDDRQSADRRPLFVGSAPDVGAFEYRGPR